MEKFKLKKDKRGLGDEILIPFRQKISSFCVNTGDFALDWRDTSTEADSVLKF